MILVIENLPQKSIKWLGCYFDIKSSSILHQNYEFTFYGNIYLGCGLKIGLSVDIFQIEYLKLSRVRIQNFEVKNLEELSSIQLEGRNRSWNVFQKCRSNDLKVPIANDHKEATLNTTLTFNLRKLNRQFIKTIGSEVMIGD